MIEKDSLLIILMFMPILAMIVTSLTLGNKVNKLKEALIEAHTLLRSVSKDDLVGYDLKHHLKARMKNRGLMRGVYYALNQNEGGVKEVYISNPYYKLLADDYKRSNRRYRKILAIVIIGWVIWWLGLYLIEPLIK